MKTTNIDVKNTIHSPYCIDMEDGNIIYNHVKKELEDGSVVVLSFDGIEILITAFLVSAVGKLFETYDAERLHSSVKAIGLHKDFEPLWDKIMKGSSRYYAHKEKIDHHTNKERED